MRGLDAFSLHLVLIATCVRVLWSTSRVRGPACGPVLAVLLPSDTHKAIDFRGFFMGTAGFEPATSRV
jgi:hypothetical protein